MKILTYFKEVLRGKDLYRILMNEECRKYELHGLVLDVGSGEGASYNRFLKKTSGTKVVPLDLKTGIDLEKDKLPYGDSSVDAVLIFNLLEHIYDYKHLMAEVGRVLKPGGKIIGSVPFLVGYHPDPHDYWRYSRESLERILKEAGFKNIRIKVLGFGPKTAAFSQLEFLTPRILKFFILPLIFTADAVLIRLKPSLADRFPLGFFFTVNK